MSRNHDAILVLHAFRPPEDLAEVVDCGVSGWCFDDSKQEGNHPFRQGQYFHSTRVQEIAEEDGKQYLVTRNTTYLYIGSAQSPEAAYNKYAEHEGQTRGPVSLTGDPVA